MSINLIQKAGLDNISYSSSLTRCLLNREDFMVLTGRSAGSVSLADSHYVGIQIDLYYTFYCSQFSLSTDNSLLSVLVYYKTQEAESWRQASVSVVDNTFIVDFQGVRPDRAQILANLRVIIENTAGSVVSLYSLSLDSVDYPIDFNYESFSVAASSQANAPLQVYNRSIQGRAQDVRVMPIYSNDFEVDQVFLLTASGMDDTDNYHVNKGIRIPEDIPWESGYFASTELSNDKVQLGPTSASGTWTSPAIYIGDDNYLSLYAYTEDETDEAIAEKDWLSVNSVLEARASNETPLPNFLILSWTKQLWTLPNRQSSLPSEFRRPSGVSSTSGPSPSASYWAKYLPRSCGDSDFVGSSPYIYGRSKRIYMKGDGTVLASSTDNNWEIASRAYTIGIPYKIFGAINDYWRASAYFGILGRWTGAGREWPVGGGACYVGTASYAHYNRFTSATETDSSDWWKGRSFDEKAMRNMLPHYLHNGDRSWVLGCAQEPVYYDYVGSTVLPIDNHPNEWMVLVATMFPCDTAGAKFMTVYLFNIRNWWVAEQKTLGSYNIGYQPASEGYAIDKCSSTGGFWIHIGYRTNRVYKYTAEGDLVATYTTRRGYNAIKETKTTPGLWMIRNDSIYYYSERGGELHFEFQITSQNFSFLQIGGIDDFDNLWLVDRDTSTVYRINFMMRQVDYENYVPWVMSVWPHPTDGTAFIYVGFDSESATPVIKRVSVNDVYKYEDLITIVPALPLSDTSGVHFTGKLSNSWISPGNNDPIWGNDDDITLEWEPYVNSSLSLPAGNYKQFRLSLRRSDTAITSPKISKMRLPLPLILKNVPFSSYKDIYINPHLRYNKKIGKFTTELVTWWPHEWGT